MTEARRGTTPRRTEKAASGPPTKKASSQQLDLFVALVGDVPLRDDREAMSLPLVSLSKRRRMKPIEWKSSNGERWVRVSANVEHGMATIWDYDVILWCVSQLNAAVENGRPVSPSLRFMPYDLLRAIGRDAGGKDYAELEAALNRLIGTLVETNIRHGSAKRKDAFHLLEQWGHEIDEATGQTRGMTIRLPQWMYDAVTRDRDVLAVSPEYFEITSGIGRWLYRLARRHAGRQATGWRFTMKGLHERSGSTQVLKDFACDVRRAIAVGVPEYRLDLLRGQTGQEVVSMMRVTKAELPQRRDLQRLRSGPVNGHGVSPAAGHGVSPAKARGITRRNRRNCL